VGLLALAAAVYFAVGSFGGRDAVDPKPPPEQPLPEQSLDSLYERLAALSFTDDYWTELRFAVEQSEMTGIVSVAKSQAQDQFRLASICTVVNREI